METGGLQLVQPPADKIQLSVSVTCNHQTGISGVAEIHLMVLFFILLNKGWNTFTLLHCFSVIFYTLIDAWCWSTRFVPFGFEFHKGLIVTVRWLGQNICCVVFLICSGQYLSVQWWTSEIMGGQGSWMQMGSEGKADSCSLIQQIRYRRSDCSRG